MNNLISITSNAADQIKKILSNAPNGTDSVIVGIDKSGCSGYAYKLDYAVNIDPMKYEIIEKDGIKIFIEPKATMFLIGSEMDYSSDKISSRFVFNNPNEKSTCGCGESFNISMKYICGGVAQLVRAHGSYS